MILIQNNNEDYDEELAQAIQASLNHTTQEWISDGGSREDHGKNKVAKYLAEYDEQEKR